MRLKDQNIFPPRKFPELDTGLDTVRLGSVVQGVSGEIQTWQVSHAERLQQSVGLVIHCRVIVFVSALHESLVTSSQRL